MFAPYLQQLNGRRRRGVVLVLILAMLGLLAVIGVTFATFSGQSQVGARYYAQSISDPDSNDVMDFALAQLINDTNNPASAIRGHSLKRDMYGWGAARNGYLAALPDGSPIVLTSVSTTGIPGQFLVGTNIPTALPALYGMNFTGWFAQLELWVVDTSGSVAPTKVLTYTESSDGNVHSSVPQTLLVGADDYSGNYHAFTLTGNDSTTYNGSNTAPGILQPNAAPVSLGGSLTYQFRLILDHRYKGAFDGAGAGTTSVYANYLYNGGFQSGSPGFYLGNPNSDALDEDYDAPDLQNWFLALQSADGQVMIPSFHRPGIIQVDYDNDPANPIDDWIGTTPASMCKFLRPRRVDHPLSGNSFPDLKPDPTTGKITYDVDNDGDGATDSVWMDLGYPIQRDSTGRMFKPLFALMVLGMNGRIPLNTAGNLQALTGSDLPDHTSHLGVSPSEINPKFALQNEPSGGQVWTNVNGFPPYSIAATSFTPPNPNLDVYGVDVSLTQLRNILAGTRPFVNPLIDPLSAPNSGANSDTNAIPSGNVPMWIPDGNYEAGQDTWPPTSSVAWRATSAVQGRWGEGSGVPANPPLDTSLNPLPGYNNLVRAGYSNPTYPVDGRDDNYNTTDPYPAFSGTITPESADYYDATGSLSIPVERIRRWVSPADLAGTGRVVGFNAGPPADSYFAGNGADTWGRVDFFQYFRPPGVPIDIGLGGATVLDTHNNPYRGYEAYRVPRGTFAAVVGAMPFDVSASMPNAPDTTPTFSNSVNSNAPYNGSSGTQNAFQQNPFQFGSLMLNEADEMQLYGPNANDAPFGPHDLEWLYRDHDVDGATLDSRLAQLAPVSFTNAFDGAMRRRMFSTDVWDVNNFIYSANTNANSALDYTGLQTHTGTNGIFVAQTGMSVARRNRRINLNFPLPVSTEPTEPVRQKWIRETYQLLKQVLPTTATDTAQELAQLSQYVVNIVDFRDPDCAMTRFVNTDIVYTPATSSAPPGLTLRTAAIDSPFTVYDPTWPGIANTDIGAAGSTNYLVQYGMEYSPIAINEVLAYQFEYRRTTGTPGPALSNRMFVELVNTLTRDGNPSATTRTITTTSPPSTMGVLAGGTVSDASTTATGGVDLSGWDMVLMDDTVAGTGLDPRSRPDPYTGQIPPGTGATVTPWQLSLTGTIPALNATGTKDGRTNYYYVLGNAPIAGAEANPVTPAATLGSAVVPPTLPPAAGGDGVGGSASRRYYWLYLRRPADPTADYTAGTRMVVVDSFRFPYIDSGAVGYEDPMKGPQTKPGPTGILPDIYSLQRLQPYRGGQAIPQIPVASPATLDTRYGYSEQTSPVASATTPFTNNTSAPASGWYGLYGSNISTGTIKNTLGSANSPNDYTSGWDYLPFHDRDFQSVAELMLVPGVPPGMFTKQFVELAPDLSQTTHFPASVPNVTPPVTKPATTATPSPTPNTTINTAGTPFPIAAGSNPAPPQMYPYLVDKFHYSGNNSDATNSDGWYQMLEYFEVPPPSLGAIGEVAAGSDYDWYRQDLRPGQLNLNLIIDEEVFFGLIDDPRLLRAPATVTPQVVTQIDLYQRPSYDVTSWTSSGTYVPTGSYHMDPTRGYYDAGTGFHLMKASFADFLRMRHGGSNFLFGWGSGSITATSPPFAFPTGMPYTGMPPTGSPQAENPFRSLSNGDITKTIMRPALMLPTQPYSPGGSWIVPGFRDTTSGYVPQIPPRRLFALPDKTAISNASETPSNQTYNTAPNFVPAAPLFNTNFSLFDNGSGLLDARLGANTGAGTNDARQHPYYRTELLSKVMNLTTVRTHQFAVWVTVGFFEVVQPGNPQMATVNPLLVPDSLGKEIGAEEGKAVRYRSFFILDRTRATGFNAVNPGDFRDLVVYRSRIE